MMDYHVCTHAGNHGHVCTCLLDHDHTYTEALFLPPLAVA